MKCILTAVFTCLCLFANTSAAQEVSILAAKLSNGSEAEKIAAAMALADLGPKAAPAVAELAAALQDKSEYVRLNTAIALGKVGAPAVAPVAKLLKSANANDRYYALWTLAWIGTPAKGVIGDITQALGDKDANVRRKAAYALGRIAPDAQTTVAPLIRLFADDNTDVRQSAAEALGKLGAGAVPGLIEALKDDAKFVQIYAAKALADVGGDAKAAVEPLGRLLASADAQVEAAAADALAKIGKASIPILVKSLQHENPTLRTRAVQALGKIGGDAVPALVDALGDKQADVRLGAATALVPLRVSDKMVVLALAHGVTDSDMRVRSQCVRGLQFLGSGAKLAAPKLIASLKEVDAATKLQICNVLTNINDESPIMLAVGVELLKDQNPTMRHTALTILAQQGKPALPHVIEAMKDADINVRIAAVNAVQRIPGDIKEALPALVLMLNQGSTFQKRTVILALSRVGEPAVPALSNLIQDTDNFTRTNAITALSNIGADAKKAVPALIEIATKDAYLPAKRSAIQAVSVIEPARLGDIFAIVKKSGDEKARAAAYGSLVQRFGKAASVPIPAELVLPLFTDAAKDASANVRLVAVMGLGTIKGNAKEIVPILTTLTADPDPRVQSQARVVLAQVKK
ncbi:MAG: HEAT repeat domain-containing protein [Gemmataceae bacterium]|nr:HEAT repeat domain-containing protein [Gemmataceae bacterium]